MYFYNATYPSSSGYRVQFFNELRFPLLINRFASHYVNRLLSIILRHKILQNNQAFDLSFVHQLYSYFIRLPPYWHVRLYRVSAIPYTRMRKVHSYTSSGKFYKMQQKREALAKVNPIMLINRSPNNGTLCLLDFFIFVVTKG